MNPQVDTPRRVLARYRVVWALRPGALAERTLPEVLRGLAGQLAEQTGMHAETVVTGAIRPLPAEIDETLLRVAQEALANTRKHANASRATITLSYLDDLVILDVADDGIGFDQAANAAPTPGVGLSVMRERITALHGRLVIESTTGDGTTIAVEVPTRPAGHTGKPESEAG
jgi:signal transduction histidine kinase